MRVRLLSLACLLMAPLTSRAGALPANEAPVFEPVASQTAPVGAAYSLTVTASDPEGDAILLSVSNAPANATFADHGDGTGTFSWTPGSADAGNHLVTFHAADTGTPMGVAALDVSIDVGAGVNHPPVLAPIGNQTVDVGVELVLTLSATDPDGDALSYGVFGLPRGATLVGPVFRFTPDASQVGSYNLEFSVGDNGVPFGFDSEEITITVGNANHPPVLAPIGDRSAVVGTRAQIALSATDADGDALVLACTGLPVDATLTDLHDGTGMIDWAPGAAGSSLVFCTATDDGVPPRAARADFTMTATPAPPPNDGAMPVLDDARWNARSGTLVVLGHWTTGTGGDAPVSIYGVAGSDSFPLGGAFSRDGRIGSVLQPFVAPCEVAAGVDGTPGPALRVTGAPADCGETLLARARAELECRDDVLHVEGRRGPPGGAIVLVDATSGADLARIPVRDHGTFSFEGIVGSSPRTLQLRAELGSLTWQLAEPLAVWRGECRKRACEGGHADRGHRGRD